MFSFHPYCSLGKISNPWNDGSHMFQMGWGRNQPPMAAIDFKDGGVSAE